MTGFPETTTGFMEHANCRNHDTNLFIDETAVNLRKAQAICGECPVADHCLTYALQLPSNTIGIYAGKTTRQLNKLRTKTDMIRHGTTAGYNKELQLGQPTCALCRAANSRYHLERKQQRVTK
jgi:WhiB family redox-sensing transcriptional regulator